MSTDGSVTESTQAEVAAATVLEQVAQLEQFQMDGSSEFPYIIIANPKKPEANWGFEVTKVTGIVHRDFTRNAYHVRKTTVLSQEKEWTATIPVQYESIKHRSILIRGPSQTLWHQSPVRYHKHLQCPATKNAHMSQQEKINKQPTRQYSHWLIVFPKDVMLENYIFSDDAIEVRTESLDLFAKVELEDTDSEDEDSTESNSNKANPKEVVDLCGQDVYWRIAMIGGDRLKSPLRKKKTRKGNRFPTTQTQTPRSPQFLDAHEQQDGS